MVCLCSLMIVLDGTIVNVALPSIQQDLGFSQQDLAWVVNAYLLTFGGFILLNVPIGVLALLLGRPLLPAAPGLGLSKGLDLGGTLAVVAAPLLAVYGIVNAGQAGWTSPVTLGCLAAALVSAVAFVFIESRVSPPLVLLGI